MMLTPLLLLALSVAAETVPGFYEKAAAVETAEAGGDRAKALRLLTGLETPSAADAGESLAALLKRADLRAKLGELEGAEADLRAALALSPKDFQTLCVLTQFLRERGRFADSLAVAQTLVTVTEGIPDYNRAEKWLQRGETLMRLERYDEAEADIARALRDKPEDHASLWLMVQAVTRRGEPRRALPFADRMVAASATGVERARALAQRGQVKELLDDGPGAEADMEAALKESPQEHVALEARMQRLRAQGRFADALALADRMVAGAASAPPTRRAILFEQRAQTRRLAGDAAGAEEDLRAALAAEPDAASPLNALAELLLDLDRAREALELADRFVSVRAKGTPEGHAQALVLRSRVKGALGRDEDAAADLKAARAAAPASAAALKAAAREARAHGRAAEALELSGKLVALTASAAPAERVEALVERALAAAELGKRAEAERDLLAADRLAAGAAFPRMTLALLALKDGRAADAERSVDRLIAASTGALTSPEGRRGLDAAAEMLLRLGRPQRALELSARLAEAEGASAAERASALARRGEALTALGRASEAAEALGAAAELTAKPGPGTDALVDALLKLGRPERALPLSERLLAAALPADRPAALERRARVLEAMGRGDDALADLRAAGEAAPGRRSPRLRAARLLAKLGRSAEALSAADALVDASSAAAPADLAEALAWRAGRRAAGGDLAGAEADHAAAEDAVPGWHARSPELGARWAAALSGRDPSAAVALLARLRAHPAAGSRERAALGAAEADARWRAGDAAKAAAVMAEALRRDARAACVSTTLAVDRSAAAPAYFDACAAKLPREASLRVDRGVSLWRRGKKDASAAEFRAALAAAPGHLPAALSLASVLEAGGKGKDAAAVLRAALAKAAPGAEGAQEAKKQLERLDAVKP